MTTHRTWHSIESTDTSKFLSWFQDMVQTYKRERHFLKGDGFFSTGMLQIRKYLLAADLTGSDNAYRSLILDAMMSAENVPGSDVWVPLALSDKFIVSDVGYHSSKQYIDWVEQYTHSSVAQEIFRSTLDQCGPLTKISVRLGEYTEPFIRYKKSFSFPIHPCPMFIQTVGKAKGYELRSPEVLFIEGAPATLSEIEAILYRSVESSRPIVLIARHFPEEVSATLGTNWKNGKLKILPVQYGTDIQTVNLAADMLAVTGGELISPSFGDILTAAIQEDEKYGSAEKVEYTGSSLEIDSDRNVSRHRASLLNALSGADEALQEIISNRVHSLTNDSIEVNIPKSDAKLHEELDMMFKHYSQFIQSGYSKTQHGILPTSIVKNVTRVVGSTQTELDKIGGFLLES